jgi:hypothetical protein
MPIHQSRLWTETSAVGVSQWVAETVRIWQKKGGLTLQTNDIIVTEQVWQIAKSNNISNSLDTATK